MNREHLKYQYPIPNAVVESMLLHTRILDSAGRSPREVA